MVTQLVKKQKGASLIEFMIASVIGVIAIGIIGSLFISSQRTASKRGQELLLLQNMAGTLQQIKEDAQRAGYDGVDTGSLKLSGATDTIHVQSSPDMLGYIYRIAPSGSASLRSVVYRHAPVSGSASSLKICEKTQSSPMLVASAADSGYKGVCFSVFDPKQIDVTAFSAVTHSVAGGKVSSAVTTVSMTAQLTNNVLVNRTMSVEIKHRNWQ